jgi:type I restriction enzyme S subunit
MIKYNLIDLLEIKNGRDHKHLEDGDVPIFGSGGIMRYGNQFLYDKPSILLPRKGTLSNIQFVKQPFWTVDTIYYSIVKEDKANPFYLFHYLKNLDLSRLNSGTGVPSMTFGAYYGIEVNLPNIQTQSQIAKVLSDLDAKIELNNRINAELEAMAKTLYDYWFVQFEFPNEDGKPYKSSGGKMVWNEELKREVPEGWEISSVNDLLIKYSDKSIHIDSKQILKKGKYPVITQDNGDYISGFTNEENPIKEIPLIVFGDHSCTLRYIDFPFFRGADGTQLMYFGDNLTIFIFIYLKSVINQLPGYGKYERHFKYLKEFKILVPESRKLKDFQIQLESIFKKISKSRLENQKLAELRDWLLPMLMNGQVMVSEL